MTDWTSPATWLVRSAVGGGLILLFTWGLMACIHQPARRQRIGEWGVLAALLLALLNWGPSWIHFDIPLLSKNFGAMSHPSWPDSQAHPPAPEKIDPMYSLEQAEHLVILPPPGELIQGEPVLEAGIMGEKSDEENQQSPNSSNEPRPFSIGHSLTVLFSMVPIDETIYFLVGGYLVCASVLVGRWLLGNIVLFHFLRHAQPVPQPVADLFAEMTSHFRKRPRLLVSQRLRVPVSCGLFQPTVVLPANLCGTGDDGRLRWVLAHEITHLMRFDSWSCLLFGLGQAIYFYCPWFWWLRRQVRLCQEYIADAAAVRQTEQREDYAQFLVSLAEAPAGPMIAIGVLGNSTDLFRRITMLLKNPLRVENACPPRWSVGVALVFLAVAVMASSIGLRAADADEKSSAKTVEEPAPGQQKEALPKEIRIEVVPDERLLEDVLITALDQEGVDIEALKKALEKLPKAEEIDKLKKDLLKEVEKLRELRPAIKAQVLNRLPGQRAILHTMPDHRLGVQVNPPDSALQEQLDLPKGQGLLIENVIPESPAAKAGFKANDILLEVNGKKISSEPGQLVKMLEEIQPNTPVDMVVIRKGKKETIKGVTLNEKSIERRIIRNRLNVPQGGLPAVDVGAAGGSVRPPLAGMIGGGNSVITSVIRTNDRFTTRHQEGSLIITLTGSVSDGKAKLNEIHVHDGNQNEKYESVDKVPERYKDKVKNLVEMSEKGNVKIEINNPRGGTNKREKKGKDVEFKTDYKKE